MYTCMIYEISWRRLAWSQRCNDQSSLVVTIHYHPTLAAPTASAKATQKQSVTRAETYTMNLTLYAINAFIVLDTDGHRVLAKYYSPKGRTHLGDPDPNKGLHTLKEQRAFEKGLFSKTKKPGGAFSSPFRG